MAGAAAGICAAALSTQSVGSTVSHRLSLDRDAYRSSYVPTGRYAMTGIVAPAAQFRMNRQPVHRK
jgi:hypothetical protein